jgi:2-polyprenyl-6-methoxyphenol hydroxylase-like FAD-dependent oxidoreductase
MMAGDVEILRGDLSRLLYDRSRDTTDYRFGDRVVGLEADGDGVTATFEHARSQTFDFVVGADGLHSGVRELAFGEEANFLRHHGYRIATFEVPNHLAPEPGARIYSAPGRAVGLFGSSTGSARALLVYTGEPLASADRRDTDGQKRVLRETFGGVGWETPRVLDALDASTDLYVDAIATVALDRYARGRVVLLGDAAYGGTLGGQGTSLAIVGAWVLVGELARGGGLGAAFTRYETTMRPYATRCQAGATRAGSFFAPRTTAGRWLRDHAHRLLTSPRMLWAFEWMVKDAATDLVLPDAPMTMQ